MPPLAFGGHYMNGSSKGDTFDADSNAYGLIAGMGTQLQISRLWNPRLQVTGLYNFHQYDQQRIDYLNTVQYAEPKFHQAAVSVSASNDFTFGKFILAPELRINYSFIHMKSYSEDDNSGLSLTVDADNYNSLQAEAGAALRYIPVSTLILEVHAHYAFEFIDQYPTLNARAAGINSGATFATTGQDMGDSSLNAGARVIFPDVYRFGFSVNYDYYYADDYAGHHASLTALYRF